MGANPRTRSTIANAASRATTGSPRSPLYQPGPEPRSARIPGGVRADECSQAVGDRTSALRDPRVRILLVDGDRLAIHRRSIAHGNRVPRADWKSWPYPGELRVVEDVPTHFADLVVTNAPRSIALSGGETAVECYERLAARPFDWSDVEVFLGDERFVPPDHPDSNEGMVRRVLFETMQPRAIHSMYRPGSIEDAADAYERLVRERPPIEFQHLGLGPDGHTASLFAWLARARSTGPLCGRDR